MRSPSRLVIIPVAALVLTVASSSCGDDYATSIDTLPPIRTTTTTFVPETTIDTTRYFYTIQAGDNLNKIAAKFCVPLSQLVALNVAVLPDPNSIPADVQIEIPSGVALIDCVPATTSPDS